MIEMSKVQQAILLALQRVHSLYQDKETVRKKELYMVCKSCGAVIEDELLLCPYCGTENEREAKKQQDEYIESVEQKIEEVKEMPKQVAKKANTMVTKLVIILIGVAAVVLVAAFVISKWIGATALDRQQKKIDQLEAYYQAGQYQELCDYLSEINEYGASFEKYRRVDEMYDASVWDIELLVNMCDIVSKYPDSKVYDDYDKNLNDVIRGLKKIEEMEQEGFPYGEGEAMLYVREEYWKALRETLLLTDEEIKAALEKYEDANTTYPELKKVTLERIQEKNGNK